MLRAIELARRGIMAGDGGPFGAVVVRDGEVVGVGWNQVLTSHDPTAHGEITAIRAACQKLGTHALDGCEIYTTGEPCPMCLGAIYWARIRVIYHGFTVQDAAAVGFDDREFFRQIEMPPDLRSVQSKPLCRAEALDLLEQYRQIPDRQIY